MNLWCRVLLTTWLVSLCILASLSGLVLTVETVFLIPTDGGVLVSRKMLEVRCLITSWRQCLKLCTGSVFTDGMWWTGVGGWVCVVLEFVTAWLV